MAHCAKEGYKSVIGSLALDAPPGEGKGKERGAWKGERKCQSWGGKLDGGRGITTIGPWNPSGAGFT